MSQFRKEEVKAENKALQSARYLRIYLKYGVMCRQRVGEARLK